MDSNDSELQCPPYKQNDSEQSTSLAGGREPASEDSEEAIKLYSTRVSKINERLKELGYDRLDHPVNCPSLLMGYEDSQRSWRASFVDSGTYVKKMGKYLDIFKTSENALASRIKELEEKKVEESDILDFTWKEERDGIVYRSNIKSYYEAHKIALNNLMTFIDIATPVDGETVFQEKNKLVQEKIDLLLKLRRLQLKALPEI